MVSNVLEMDQRELIELLKTFKQKYTDDTNYTKLRAELPKGWPL